MGLGNRQPGLADGTWKFADQCKWARDSMDSAKGKNWKLFRHRQWDLKKLFWHRKDIKTFQDRSSIFAILLISLLLLEQVIDYLTK
jgi:hypothetical protein